jgi:hypothetical protein
MPYKGAVAMPVQGVAAMPVQAAVAMPMWVAVAAMPMQAVAVMMCAQVGGNCVPVWGSLVRNDLNGRKKKKECSPGTAMIIQGNATKKTG